MLGAVPQDDGLVCFSVWAPNADRVSVLGCDLEADADGVYSGLVEARPGDDYRYLLDGAQEWADPCSRSQPEGVLGPSRIVDASAFAIRPGPELTSLVIYELHVARSRPRARSRASSLASTSWPARESRRSS